MQQKTGCSMQLLLLLSFLQHGAKLLCSKLHLTQTKVKGAKEPFPASLLCMYTWRRGVERTCACYLNVFGLDVKWSSQVHMLTA